LLGDVITYGTTINVHRTRAVSTDTMLLGTVTQHKILQKSTATDMEEKNETRELNCSDENVL